MREDAHGTTYVQHLKSVRVTTVRQVLTLVRQGNENRSVRQTDLNEHSSRGHAILQLLLEQRPSGAGASGDAARTVTRTKLNFVDLAVRTPAQWPS